MIGGNSSLRCSGDSDSGCCGVVVAERQQGAVLRLSWRCRDASPPWGGSGKSCAWEICFASHLTFFKFGWVGMMRVFIKFANHKYLPPVHQKLRMA